MRFDINKRQRAVLYVSAAASMLVAFQSVETSNLDFGMKQVFALFVSLLGVAFSTVALLIAVSDGKDAVKPLCLPKAD